MSVARVVLWATGLIVAALAIFYYFSDYLVVRIAGGLAIVTSAYSLVMNARAIGLNKRAFQVAGNPTLPLLQQRRLLGFFRQHAESAEDKIFGILTDYTLLIACLAVLITPWWFCIAALLHSVCNLYSLRRSWPAYALILGASNQQSTRSLVRLVAQEIRPLFTANLLNMITHDEIEHELFVATSYRLKNEVVSWRGAVEAHAALAKLVFLDMTTVTPFVVDEARLIRDSGFWYKAAVMCPTQASLLAAADLLDAYPDTLVVESDRDVVTAIQVAGRFLATPPSSAMCWRKMIDQDALRSSLTKGPSRGDA